MAIDYSAAGMLIAARNKGVRLGRVLTLGRLHLSLTDVGASRLSRDFDIPIQKFAAGDADSRYSEDFLNFLGAESITSLDFSDYQGSSICHDMNRPIPDEWKASYDTVIDGGTIEHIFNAPVAIQNAMELIAEGGHYFGASPANDWLGHGFYQFSPEWYFRIFAPENGFDIVNVVLAEDHENGKIYKVDDPAKAGTRIGINSSQRIETIVLAKRTKLCPIFETTPQQSDYSARWSKDETSGTLQTGSSPLRQLLKRIVPASVRLEIQKRAIAKRYAAEYARGLHEIRSFSDL
jgi:hypothetical protein